MDIVWNLLGLILGCIICELLFRFGDPMGGCK